MGFYVVQFLTGLASASSLFLIAVGLSIVFGVTRIVNLAHGSLYMLGAYIAYSLIEWLSPGPFGFWVALVGAAVLVGLIGIVIEVLLLKRIYQAPELFQLVGTFGVVLVVQDLALAIWGPTDKLGPRAPGLAHAVRLFGEYLPQYDIALIVLGPLVLAALWFLFRRTRWGTLVRAATQDREMVGALGVNQAWLFTSVFFLGAFLAGLGGAAQLPKGGANLMMDLNIIAEAFVVVVVGGMGSIVGAFLAALLIAELNAFGILIFPQITLVLMFLVMAVVLIFRPWGLLGRPDSGGGHAGPPEPPMAPAGPHFRLLLAAVAAALLVLPLIGDEVTLILAIDILIFVLFAASLHFMMGPAGMISFGHAAYFGLGAYAVALSVKYLGTPMELALFYAPLLAGLGGLVIGWFCVRLSGVYLAMLTLAFAQIVWSVVFQWYGFTGGDDGILGIRRAPWADQTVVFYYLVLVLCAAGVLLLRGLLFSPFGYSMRAVRDSALRAGSIGINTHRQQWLGFALAGLFAGIAGGLYAYSKGSVFPALLSIPRSIDGLVMVLLGGVQTLSGPVVGATAFVWLDDVITRFEFWRLILGALIIALVLAFPQGIAGFARARFGRIFGIRTLETE